MPEEERDGKRGGPGGQTRRADNILGQDGINPTFWKTSLSNYPHIDCWTFGEGGEKRKRRKRRGESDLTQIVIIRVCKLV